MAKGSAKKPKESKCRGSGATLEGRDWVRIGGSKWLREIAEKQGKFISLEYREKSGADFVNERNARAEEAEKAPIAALLAEDKLENDDIPEGEPPLEEEEGTYGVSAVVEEEE